MDIRGIEVTNQLRSAIRAKLLELGVRYDEELPDYILVMVVNKKTRQQMHEDLRLFLEENTSPFVDWLHDQVLKKLQKVTLPKKKSSRELVPTVVVKQEEERRKRKTSATSFLDDQPTDTSDKSVDKNAKLTKLPKKIEKTLKSTSSLSTTEESVTAGCENTSKKPTQIDNFPTSQVDEKLNASVTATNLGSSSIGEIEDLIASQKIVETASHVKHNQPISLSNTVENLSKSAIQTQINVKMNEISTKNSTKQSSSSATLGVKSLMRNAVEKGSKDTTEDSQELNEENSRKIKSSVNRPKVTSVVTVKGRLEFPPPRHNFDTYKQRIGYESRLRRMDRNNDRYDVGEKYRNNISNNRLDKEENYSKRNQSKGHDSDCGNHEPDRVSDIKSRLGYVRDDKVNKNSELNDNMPGNSRMKVIPKFTSTVKGRLGLGNNSKATENALSRRIDSPDKQRHTKQSGRDISINNSISSIKSRLGPVKNVIRASNVRKRSNVSDDEDLDDNDDDDDDDDDYDRSVHVGPVKSRIIAVKRGPDKNGSKRPKILKNDNASNSKSEDELDIEDSKVASKVIVTPRPLKPLQPAQKRATQSLLLRAVAEANQSVVKQKNPEPVLTEMNTLSTKRPIVKSTMRKSRNLSVRINSKKRIVMEKIQVELNTDEAVHNNPETHISQPVTDEHMGVVMSLFQRSNDDQKFLVTLNGYNNNVTKDKTLSEEEERLEMEVNEEDEILLTNVNLDESMEDNTSVNDIQLENNESLFGHSNKIENEESNESHFTDNIENRNSTDRRNRKLSPIVYNRSRSSSPVTAAAAILPMAPVKHTEKRTSIDATQPSIIEKSKEKCRYWPNCTLENACTYYHPAILCSTFPACKFGDKCLYKHPKCKYGLACTKVGCVFGHPTKQCKYYPYCNNPTCPYAHVARPSQPVEIINDRAKFIWRKRE